LNIKFLNFTFYDISGFMFANTNFGLVHLILLYIYIYIHTHTHTHTVPLYTVQYTHTHTHTHTVGYATTKILSVRSGATTKAEEYYRPT